MRKSLLLERSMSCSSWTTSEVLGSKVCCIVSLAILDTDPRSLDLDSLILTYAHLVVDDPSLPLPFSLSTLALALPKGQDYGTLHYLVTQCQPSLVELELWLPQLLPSVLPYLAAFIPIAHQLTKLDLQTRQDDPMATPFLSACTALSYLTAETVTVPWVKALRVALQDLAVMEVQSEGVDRLIELIEDGVLGVSKLESLTLAEDAVSKLAGAEGAEGDVLDNWGELAKLCREKGIKIEASVVFVSLTQ
jgi:hypothetical protein